MSQEERELATLKNGMSAEQQAFMAEIIGNELKRREQIKSGEIGDTKGEAMKTQNTRSAKGNGMTREQVGELYADMSSAVREIRERKLKEQIAQAKGAARQAQPKTHARQSRMSAPSITMPKIALPNVGKLFSGLDFSNSNSVLMYGVLSFGVAKVVFSAMPASGPNVYQEFAAPQPAQVASIQEQAAVVTEGEKAILLALDDRRVQLESKKAEIQDRERELEKKEVALSERLAELKSLTNKLSIATTDQDKRYEARLSQLSDVYGSMAPTEAATLIAKLDNDIALGLLERMPGKRMGQILALMPADRAIELTKILTEKKGL